jgi:ribosomal protein S6
MKKELQIYELVLFFKVNLSESKLKTIIEKYKDFLIGKGSQVMIKNNKRISLAYPIQKFETATYIQIFYLSNGSLIKQLNTEIQRDEEILRSVTTTILEQSIPDVFDNGTS